MPLVPTQWLAEHVEIPEGLTAQELAAALVKVGLEEETIHSAEVTGPVVVGKVLARSPEKQKNGKVVNYCRVDVGEHNDAPGTGKEPSDLPSRGIICGAHNFDVGDYVAVSLPGAVLPGGFAISARKTYGHLSDGMICSALELGLGEDHDGIIVLAAAGDDEAVKKLPGVGCDVLPYLGIGGETLEINITPDRGYCFSMRGVAREYHHSTGGAFTDRGLPESRQNFLDPGETADSIPSDTENGFAVEVRDGSPIHGNVGCDRFVTRIVRGIDPKAESPKWLRDRLTAAGMRPISLAVDATNYVMLDLGQPLHAYDLDKMRGPIVVRRARAGERHTTLDDVERTLDPEDLLITDDGAERVLGIAGVMGGADTEITGETVNVLIEAAHFDPVSIARSARRHKLASEASKRFERGADPELPPVAAQNVVDLLVKYGGGTAGDEVFDLRNFPAPEAQDFRLSEVERLTGLDLSDERIIGVLREIGCEVEVPEDGASGASGESNADRPAPAGNGSGDVEETENGASTGGEKTVRVTPPTWRPDLIGPAHFVEEVARLVGYDEIPVRLPRANVGRGITAVQRARRDAARTLAEQGWVQVLSYPFISADALERQGIAAGDERRRLLRLANPLQEDAPYLRSSILDSLLETARLNVSRSNPSVAVFEQGLVTQPENLVPAAPAGVGARPSDAELKALHCAIPSQPHHVAGVACGPKAPAAYGYAPEPWDWRDAIEAAFSVAACAGVDVVAEAAECAPWHPGRCARIQSKDGRTVGYAGELAPAVCKAWGLPARSVAFEVDMDALTGAESGKATSSFAPLEVKPVTTAPAAKEDIALVVDSDVTAAQVENVIRKAAGDLLESAVLFDVYTGDQVGKGKKSLAFALRFRSDHTLTAEETAGVRKRIVKAARKSGAELRA
ncbi:phenylalanine--tRNA ligase, beta subunit [Actinomyces sp. oral taxon 848 str. F0332]|nr:phenylalanine--tRNA ligase, beta subunit [Actinomyces sp. oral taxon 848 str. F0332]